MRDHRHDAHEQPLANAEAGAEPDGVCVIEV